MKLNQIAGVMLLAFFATSCALNKKAFKASENVAVISIYSMDKVKNNSSLQARILSDARMKDTVLTDPAEMVKSHLFDLNRGLIRKFADEAEIVSSESFQTYAAENDNLDENFDKFVNLGVKYEGAKGYPVIKHSDKKTIMAAFDHLPRNIDAVLVLSNNFAFQEDMAVSVGGISTSGLAKQRVNSTITIYMVNHEGKKIFYKSFIGVSQGKLGQDDNRYSLNDLANQALDDSFGKLNAYLIKKMGS